MAVLLPCRWKFLHKETLWQTLFDWSWLSLKNRFLSHPSSMGLRGNVRTPPIARWKARGRLSIRHSWTFFAISYGWDVISGNLSKSAFFEGVGHFREYFGWKGTVPATSVTVERLEISLFRVVLRHSQKIISFCHNTRIWQTDWQTEIATAIPCVALHAVAR